MDPTKILAPISQPASGSGPEAHDRDQHQRTGAARLELGGEKAVVFVDPECLEPEGEIVDVNVLGTSHVYEAARRCGIGRVVLGSSNHVVGFYPQTVVVGPSHPMRPDSQYGLSKCWGELVAGLYFDKAGIRSLIIRIGNASERPKTLRSLAIWVSPADLAQLTLIGLTHPDVDATVVFGVSAGGQWWDNSRAEALGYVPQDRIADFADSGSLAPGADEADPVGSHFQGGRFCIGDHDGIVRDR